MGFIVVHKASYDGVPDHYVGLMDVSENLGCICQAS